MITLLPKADQPNNDWTNVRPNSLLNADVKALCKTLAPRAEGITPKTVGKDQNGFIC